MPLHVKLKEAFEVESKHGAFFTGGNVEWLSNEKLICQKEFSLQILDTESGTVTCTIGDESEANTDSIHTFTTDSSRIITSHKSGLLKSWTHEGALEKVWKYIHKGPISVLRLHQEGELLASGGTDSSVRLWNLKHQACILNLKGAQGVISIAVFHPKENLLFAAGDDAKVNCWDLLEGKLVNVYNGHFSKVTSILFTDDNEHIITAGRDKVIILWNLKHANAIRTLPVFECIESMVLLPLSFELYEKQYEDGIFVATAGSRGVIRLWNLKGTPKEIYSQTNSLVASASEDDGLSITKILFTDGIITVVTVDHNILLHSLNNFECLKQFVGFSDEILDMVFVGKDDSHLAIATNSVHIKIYNNSSMTCHLLKGHTDIVLALCKSPSNPNILISSSKDNSVRVWSFINNDVMNCIAVGSRHTGSVSSVFASQLSLEFILSVSVDTCIKKWKFPDISASNQLLECTKTEIAHQKDINCVTVSPNDKIFATGSQDKTAKLWTENLELIGSLRGHKRGIWCVRFSPVDQVVITSSADCTVKLWSVIELTCLKTLEGHSSSVLKTEFLSNGMQILTSGADGLLKIFSVKTSLCAVNLDLHEGRVWAVAIKSDESVIVSGGSDSLLVKWKDVTTEKRLQKLKEDEEFALQEQKLNNLVHNNELLKALELALHLERPHQTLKIIKGIIKSGEQGLTDAIRQLSNEHKESLLNCVTEWNTNSKHSQQAQIVLNILISEIQMGKYTPNNFQAFLEANLPYTERHFKRVTQLLQDLQYITYAINTMKPYAKEN